MPITYVGSDGERKPWASLGALIAVLVIIAVFVLMLTKQLDTTSIAWLIAALGLSRLV